MAEENLFPGFSEDEIYQKVEEAVRSVPEVVDFTASDFRNFIEGISYVFGIHPHRGMLIHRGKKGIKTDLSISVVYGPRLDFVCEKIQRVVREVLCQMTSEPIRHINVVVTNIVRVK